LEIARGELFDGFPLACMQFVLFTDNIADLSVRDACRAAKRSGYDGLDLTLRGNGHVRPENAEQGLAEADDIADQESVTIPMVETAIQDVTSPHAESIIAAVHARVRTFKLGYWRYETFGTALKQLDEARRKLEGIIRLARRYHVRPCIHVHSGPVLTNSPLIYSLLKDYSPDELGAYVDVMHMTLEGGRSGWEMTLDMIAPWVTVVGIKDFVFVPGNRDEFGQQRFQTAFVPIGDGMVPFPQFFQRLKQLRFDGIISFHAEYKKPPQPMTTPQLLDQAAKDLRFLKGVIARL
jgi:sugar phosphate isomerase/epimerase